MMVTMTMMVLVTIKHDELYGGAHTDSTQSG